MLNNIEEIHLCFFFLHCIHLQTIFKHPHLFFALMVQYLPIHSLNHSFFLRFVEWMDGSFKRGAGMFWRWQCMHLLLDWVDKMHCVECRQTSQQPLHNTNNRWESIGFGKRWKFIVKQNEPYNPACIDREMFAIYAKKSVHTVKRMHMHTDKQQKKRKKICVLFKTTKHLLKSGCSNVKLKCGSTINESMNRNEHKRLKDALIEELRSAAFEIEMLQLQLLIKQLKINSSLHDFLLAAINFNTNALKFIFLNFCLTSSFSKKLVHARNN